MRAEETADIAVEQALGADRTGAGIEDESAASVRVSLLEKWKRLDFASRDEFLVRRETQKLWEFHAREEESYARFAARADKGLERIAAKVQEFEAQLAAQRTALPKLQKESSSISARIDRKMAKLSLVTDLMKGKTGDNTFLQAAAALFGMLRSPIGTDEQIRLCFGSVVTIARANAQSEEAEKEAPQRPPNRESIEATLRALTRRIAERRLQPCSAAKVLV